tara:strand:+ start:211 stop:339 length:129 start_codon:yes stop_codon:yes gene_type:complete
MVLLNRLVKSEILAVFSLDVMGFRTAVKVINSQTTEGGHEII